MTNGVCVAVIKANITSKTWDEHIFKYGVSVLYKYKVGTRALELTTSHLDVDLYINTPCVCVCIQHKYVYDQTNTSYLYSNDISKCGKLQDVGIIYLIMGENDSNLDIDFLLTSTD
jgi:hypothetical protein